jgi:hypothetical protein
MQALPLTSDSESAVKTRSMVFVLLGAAVLLLKRHYAGPLDEVVHAYAGNLSISFALYFYLRFSLGIVDYLRQRFPTRIRKLVAALVAFAAVELFEAFDGFGVMSNTYDPIDFLVNPIGIAFGFWLDTKLGTVRNEDARTNPS